MNREIKFRAWDKKENKFIEDFTGVSNEETGQYYNCGIDCDGSIYVDIHGEHNEGRYVIQQYTCLKDKEGKEIYEGDIIEVSQATSLEKQFKGVVAFNDGTFCLEQLIQPERAIKSGIKEYVRFWNDGDHEHYSIEMICDGWCKVDLIGNIFENPELLKPCTK